MNIRDYLIRKHGGHRSRQLSSENEIALPSCPGCGKGGDHFNYNVLKNRGGCLKCGWGVAGKDAAVALIAKLEEISFENARFIVRYGDKEKLDAVADLLTFEMPSVVESKETLHVNTELPQEFELMIDSLRARIHMIPVEFGKRFYPTSVIEHFHLGFCRSGNYNARIIFPVRCLDMKSFVARSILSWMTKKYKNPPGSKHSQLLYNYNRIEEEDQIYVCEGPTDVLRLTQYGLQAVCTFGKKISTEQVDLLYAKRPKEVVVIFDADAVSQNVKAFEKLSLRLNASYVLLPKKSKSRYYDPDDVPLEILREKISERIGISKLDNTIHTLKSFTSF
jgi:5S rRNA maturation endonuclease (ribonuclease M5)